MTLLIGYLIFLLKPQVMKPSAVREPEPVRETAKQEIAREPVRATASPAEQARPMPERGAAIAAIERPVKWNRGSDLSHLAGRTVQLRFVLRDADVYAYQFLP